MRKLQFDLSKKIHFCDLAVRAFWLVRAFQHNFITDLINQILLRKWRNDCVKAG